MNSNSQGTVHSRRSQPFLRVCSVSRSFDDGSIHALNNVSFEVHRGEYVALMGASGSGKSTLLNLLGGLDRPTSGDVEFNGRSLFNLMDLDQFRARTLGFVFQSFHLLPTLTAIENVQIPMFEGSLGHKDRVRRAQELLALVGLTHRLRHVPAKLSVGERQRVAIARALANNPQLLLADEPTGNLDSAATTGVLDIFDSLHQARGLTLIVITHNPAVAARAERTITLHDGRIIPSRVIAEEPAPCAL